MNLDMTIGFIGTGGITSAMVRGLCEAAQYTGRIIISVHKNREHAEELKSLYPQRITICESNQRIVDAADIVSVALPPTVHEEVVGSLKFNERQKIMHITGGIKLEKSAPLYTPAKAMVRAIPLPFVARNMGPILYFGEDDECRALFELMGTVVKVKSERELEIMGPVTGLMVPYYALVAEYVKWAGEKGIDFQSVLDYSCCMNEALSRYMRSDCGQDVEKFLTDNSTPHGVNEMGLKLLRDKGAFSLWSQVLDALYIKYNALDKK